MHNQLNDSEPLIRCKDALFWLNKVYHRIVSD